LRILDSRNIEIYDEALHSKKNFYLNNIFNHEDEVEKIFGRIVKPLIKSAFDEGLQHTLVLYEPTTPAYSMSLLGLGESNLPIEETLLYFSIKHILNMASSRRDLNTQLQVSLAAVYKKKCVDLFNKGNLLDAPLGYNIENLSQIEPLIHFCRGQLKTFYKYQHLCLSLFYKNTIVKDGKEEVL